MFEIFANDKITKIGNIDSISMEKNQYICFKANLVIIEERFLPLFMIGKSFNIAGQNKPFYIYLKENLWIAHCWFTKGGTASKYDEKIIYKNQDILAESFIFCKDQKKYYETFCIYDNSVLLNNKLTYSSTFNETINSFIKNKDFNSLKDKIEKLNNLKVFW